MDTHISSMQCQGCEDVVMYLPYEVRKTVLCKCGHINPVTVALTFNRIKAPWADLSMDQIKRALEECYSHPDHLRDVMQKKQPEQVKDENRAS